MTSQTSSSTPGRITEILQRYESEILSEWTAMQLSVDTMRPDLLKERELRDDSRTFLKTLRHSLELNPSGDFRSSEWSGVRDFLADLSRNRAALGFSPSETAVFVFSLKQPLFSQLQKVYESDTAGLLTDVWRITTLFDKLGLFTVEVFQKGREEVISRQQLEMLELSTPVVRLYEGILALPLIGTLDSARTQVVMENLLNEIVQSSASIAIIDITGVPTVDTLVAQHLLKTVEAARLMGAECIISGIRPQIAQTIVHLGVDLNAVTTKASMAAALGIALQRLGYSIRRQQPQSEA